MSGKARFLLGGCGALAPIVVNLLVVDLVAVFQELKLLVVAGYAVKVIILFVIGGMWAFMHKTEMEPLNVFQLGIVAPAVILSMNNGFNFRGKLEEGGGPQSADHVSALFTVPTAYAGLPGLGVRSRDPWLAESTMIVRGTVAHVSTNRPLEAARVSVAGISLATLTDAAGRFELVAPRRPVELEVRRLGYRVLRRALTPATAVAGPLRLLLDPAVIDLNAVVFTDVAAPTANGKAQFIAGLFGMPRADSSWYVLGEEFSDPEAARRRAGELTALSDWQTAVKVYVTQSASGTRYTVGWAGNLTLSDAKKAAARISNLAGGAKARVERAPWK